MIYNFIKYTISLILFGIFGLIILDNVLLPVYVNTNKEIYIPDVRGMYKNNAINKLKSLDLKVKIENIPFTKESEIGKVVKMSPPSPLKLKQEE